MKRKIKKKTEYIDIKQDTLSEHHFSESGLIQFKNCINIFAKDLLEQIKFREKSQKIKKEQKEFNGDNVIEANLILRQKLVGNKRPTLLIILNIAEYPIMGIAGIGASNITTLWGAITLVACLILAGSTVFFRITKEQEL
ncbi:hypothetical protein LPTSP3_g30890 [Leptospira kobayashii]|uniref:Uncharacterized protein n=1 Tax=Leptospira kobayashii TaxID=1917830 RepID=A0ABN6KJP7_9LEPT|nr:hypothetical protein [Leptospira kobayashii]BDA80159.1 hypothetical protein LPTSP3_g30890 [Leptospira kobayashii]